MEKLWIAVLDVSFQVVKLVKKTAFSGVKMGMRIFLSRKEVCKNLKVGIYFVRICCSKILRAYYVRILAAG